MKRKIATLLSKIFEPMILMPLAFITYASRVGIPLFEILLWIMSILGPIVGYRLWMRGKGIDWDIKERKERGKPFMKLMLFSVFVCIGMWIFEPRLSLVFFIFFVWIVGFYIITTRYTKISGHTGGDALATGLLIQSLGWNFWPVLLIVPIVAWSRVVRKDHTVGQVIAGALYSWVLLITFHFSLISNV